MLPYVSLWHRLLIAFSYSAATGTAPTVGLPVVDFAVNPLRATLDLLRDDVERVIFVTSEDWPRFDRESLPLDPDALDEIADVLGAPDLPDDEGEAGRIAVEAAKAGKRVVFTPNGLPLTIDDLWEFVPYNDASFASLVTPKFIRDVGRWSPDLRSPNPVTVQKAIDALKRVYDQQFGSTGRMRNIISLFLYSGPLRQGLSSDLTSAAYSPAMPPVIPPGVCRILPAPTTNPGVMYTGDGFLKKPAELVALVKVLTTDRRDDAGVFQVMHHGAAGNWHSGVEVEFNPQISVFCSNPRVSPYHPHPSVLRAFWPYGATQVDQFWKLEVSGKATRI